MSNLKNLQYLQLFQFTKVKIQPIKLKVLEDTLMVYQAYGSLLIHFVERDGCAKSGAWIMGLAYCLKAWIKNIVAVQTPKPPKSTVLSQKSQNK